MNFVSTRIITADIKRLIAFYERITGTPLTIFTEDFAELNLRVDSHAEPFVEMRRLLDIWRRTRSPFLGNSPSKANPAGVHDLDTVEANWIKQGLNLRFRR